MILKIVKVDGNSMHPALESGAFVLLWQHHPAYWQYFSILIKPLSTLVGFNSLCLPFTLKVGDIVAVNHPKFGCIIKRVVCLEYQSGARLTQPKKELDGADHNLPNTAVTRLRLQGDNLAASTSEAAMGWIDAKYLIGKVIYQVNPLSTQ